MSRKYTDTASPQKGMVTDIHPNNQPDGSYRFALNAVQIGAQGEQGFLSIEPGNIACYDIPNDYYVIGAIPLVDNKVVLFLVSDDNERSEIGLGDNHCTYTTIINSTCLGFTKENQIQGTYSIVNGCETVVYFACPTMYAINIDSVDSYLLTGYTQTTANADGEGWDCDLFKQFPAYTRPILITLGVNNTGGNLPLGSYHIVTAYIDESGNSPGWLDFSNPIPIVDESFSGSFEAIDGGFNSEVAASSKSISFTYSNIDTSYKNLRVGLVASNDGVRSGYIITDIPITSSFASYTITSIDTAEEVPITELVVSPVVYEQAKTVTQINNRLVYANLKGKAIDHGAFQRAVNEAKVTWVADTRNLNSPTSSSYKSPDEFVWYRGYMRDEVYALGIVFQFKDGYISPVYHIPGREKNTGKGDYYVGNVLPANYEPNTHNRPVPIDGWDDSEYTVTASTTPSSTEVYIGDVQHLGYAVGDTVERWEAFNTATRETSTDYTAEGEMAYWESELDYPDTVDCDGNRVYPTGKIRHHKMPDTTLMEHGTLLYTYPIAIKVANISVPAEYEDQVAGFMIVRVKRDETNTTVIDKGLITNTLYKNDKLFQPYPYNYSRDWIDFGVAVMDDSFQCIHTPRLKFFQEAVGASYIKYERIVRGVPEYFIADLITPERWVSQARFYDGAYIPPQITTNRSIIEQIFMDTDTNSVSIGVSPTTFDNTEQQEVFVARLDTPTVNIKDAPGYSFLDLIGISETSTYMYYGSIKKVLTQQYGQVTSLVYIPTHNNFSLYNGSGDSLVVYGGDTFISELTFRRTARISGYVPCNHDDGLAPNDLAERHIVSVLSESTINCGYRNEGATDTEVYYPKSYPSDPEQFAELELWTSADTTDIDNRLLDVIPNFYDLNLDFIQENDLKIFLPLPSTYDFCSSCQEEFTTRIIFSEVKTNEEASDGFKIFLPNNYRDLTLNKGEITNLFIQDYKLFAHLENTLINLPTNPQVIATDTASTYLGNAGFLEIEPVEIKSINEGYLGSNAQWATVTSEFGTLFVSKDKVFLLQDTLQEVSNLGMRQFFIDNKLVFGESFRELMLEFSASSTLEFEYLDNPANINGVGYIACFDRDKNRFILHKRDYKILFGIGSVEEPVGFWGSKNTAITYPVGAIVFNSDTGWFEQAGAVISSSLGQLQAFTPLEFTDTELFENKSYTISFDPSTKQWLSFHSYLPNFMFNTYNKWYTFNTNHMGSIYEHNAETFQKYYGSFAPHIIELVTTNNPKVSSVTKFIEYVSEAKKFNSTYNEWVDVPYVTFTKAWLYNSNQSSDYFDLVVSNQSTNPLSSTVYTDGEAPVFKAEGTWRFNRFYNAVIDTSIPFTTSSWSDILSDFFIDKLPNPAAHGTVSPYQREKFRDKYSILRLVFERTLLDGKGNVNLFTQYIFGEDKYSNR